MIIYAIYFITNEGVPILTESFQHVESLPDEMLLGGLFTALQGVASEMTNGKFQIQTLETEGLAFHVRSFPFYRIVLITDTAKTSELQPSEDIIQQIGLQFTRKFRDKLGVPIFDVSPFQSFKKTIREIVKPEALIDDDRLFKPEKRLTAIEIMSLSHHLHTTAKAMVYLQSKGGFTIADISEETEDSKKTITDNLRELQQLGYVGQKGIKEKKVFFISF